MLAAYHQKQHIVNFLLESAVYVEEHKRFHSRTKRASLRDAVSSDSGASSVRTTSCCGHCTHSNNNVSPSLRQLNLRGSFQAQQSLLNDLSPTTEYCSGWCAGDSCCQADSGLWAQSPTTNRSCSKIASSDNLLRHFCPDSPARETLPSFPAHETIPEEEAQTCTRHGGTCACSREPQTTAEVERYDELLNMLQLHDAELFGRKAQLPPEDDPEKTLHENVSSLLDSMQTVSRRGSVYVTELMVSHLCATSPRDGSSVFHKAVEGGDNVALLEALLKCDESAVNAQDCHGLTPLHVACLMKRRKIVEKLTVIRTYSMHNEYT